MQQGLTLGVATAEPIVHFVDGPQECLERHVDLRRDTTHTDIIAIITITIITIIAIIIDVDHARCHAHRRGRRGVTRRRRLD